MWKRDVLVIMGTAVVVAVAVAGLWVYSPVSLAYAAPEERVKAAPVLDVGDIVFALKMDKTVCQVGDKPVVTLTAVNAGKRSAEAHVEVRMMKTALASMMSCMMPVPEQVWSKTCALSLAPGQKTEMKLRTEVAMEKGQSVSFILLSGKKSIPAGSLAVVQ